MLNPELRERLWPFLAAWGCWESLGGVGATVQYKPVSFNRLLIFAFSMRQELNKAIDRADGVIPI